MYPEIAASVETLGKKLQDETKYEKFRLKLFSEKFNTNQGLITKLNCFNPNKHALNNILIVRQTYFQYQY